MIIEPGAILFECRNRIFGLSWSFRCTISEALHPVHLLVLANQNALILCKEILFEVLKTRPIFSAPHLLWSASLALPALWMVKPVWLTCAGLIQLVR